MFNVHLYDQKLKARRQVEHATLQQLLTRKKKLSQRNTLTANYARRVDRFIMNMANDPIQVSKYAAPLAIVQRDVCPSKFKGPPRMIIPISTSATSLDLTANDHPDHPIFEYCKKPYDFRPRDRSKEIQPRKADLRKGKTKPAAAYSQPVSDLHSLIATPRDSSLPRDSDSSLSSSQVDHSENKPQIAAVFQGFDRKTHFKGVLSRLVEKGSTGPTSKENEEYDTFGPTFHRSRTASILWRHAKVLKREFLKESESNELAKEILETCQVIPKIRAGSFLKKGDGRIRRLNKLVLSNAL